MQWFQHVKLFPPGLYWCFVQLSDARLDAQLEFFKRVHSDVSKKCSRHTREYRLDQVQPETMFGRVNVLKAVRACCQVRPGFLRSRCAQHDGPALSE